VGDIHDSQGARQRAPLRAAVPAKHEDLVVVGDEPRPFIPPGTYDATGVAAKRGRVKQQPKLLVLFDVHVPDREAEFGIRLVRLAKYYNVSELPGGRLRAPRNGDYSRDWMRFTGRRITRHDRLDPAALFVGALFSVEVATVKRDREQVPLPEPHAFYSKVARVLERKAGGVA
jgi:hypothetical protein